MTMRDPEVSYLRSGVRFADWYTLKLQEIDALQSRLDDHPTDTYLAGHLARNLRSTRRMATDPNRPVDVLLGDLAMNVKQDRGRGLPPRGSLHPPATHLAAPVIMPSKHYAAPIHHRPIASQAGVASPRRGLSSPPSRAQRSSLMLRPRGAFAMPRDRGFLRTARVTVRLSPSESPPIRTPSSDGSQAGTLSSLWQRRQSPRVQPLDEIKRLKDFEALEENRMLLRARAR